MATYGQNRKLRSHIFNCTEEAKRVKWQWEEAVNSQSLVPVTCFFQKTSLPKGCITSLRTPTEKEIFKKIQTKGVNIISFHFLFFLEVVLLSV